MTINGPRVVAYDELGDVTPALERVVEQLGGRCWSASSFAELGRVLDDAPDLHLLVAAVDAIDPGTLDRLTVVHEELPALQILLVTRTGLDNAPLRQSSTIDGAVRQLLRAGVADVLAHPIECEELAQSVKRAHVASTGLCSWARRFADGNGGTLAALHAVSSARGGVGRTFFAINLATALAGAPAANVCLIDLDVPLGGAASALGLQPRFTVMDALRAGDDLASHVSAYCERADGRFSLLGAPRPEEAAAVTAEDAVRLVNAARREFTHVVVDLPPVTSGIAVGVLRDATERWCLTKTDVPCLRTLTSLLPTLERFDIAPSALKVVLNMVESGADISVDELDELLPQGLTAALPYSRRALHATNAANTIFDVDPSGELARRLQVLFAPYTDDPSVDADLVARTRGARSRRWRRG